MDEKDLIKNQIASTILLVVEILISLGIIWGFHHTIHNIGENTIFWKGYYAKDTALLIDSLNSGTGEAEYVYYLVKPGLNINLFVQDDKVSVEDNIRAVEKAPRWFPFAVDTSPSNNLPDVKVVPEMLENPTSLLFKREAQPDNTVQFTVETKAQEKPLCKKFNLGIELGLPGSLLLAIPSEPDLSWLTVSVNNWFKKDESPVREWNAKVIIRVLYTDSVKNDFVCEYPQTGMIQQEESIECFVREKVPERFPDQFNSFQKNSVLREDFDFHNANTRKLDETIFINLYIGSKEFWSNENLDATQKSNMQRAMSLAVIQALEDWSQ
ncbi:hypothetical protein JW868_02895 [Candidatus Woesearchaeota archaeon]|nr:hypothetical protein [Candidatus Woesearchaeota archaeon]